MIEGKVLRILDALQKLTTQIETAAGPIVEGPTVAEISDHLSGSDGGYSVANVYDMLLDAEVEGWIAWPTSERSRNRRISRTILLTPTGREALKAWQEQLSKAGMMASA